MEGSFWPKDSLIIYIVFELYLIWYISPVTNFGTHSLEFPPSNSQTSFDEGNGSDDSNFDCQDDNMNESFVNEDPLVIGFSYETVQEGKNLRKTPKSNRGWAKKKFSFLKCIKNLNVIKKNFGF